MSYEIQTLDSSASNFGSFVEGFKTKPDEVKFILNDPLPSTPLHAEVQKRFNSVIIPEKFKDFIEGIRNLEVYEDDIWVFAFPRSGSNWTQETVWQVCNEVDTENKELLNLRFPVIEESALINRVSEVQTSLDQVKNMKRPRFIKSHLPIAFLPFKLWEVKPKIVYVSREAKDAAVSWHYFYKEGYLYKETLQEYLKLYLKGEVEYGSYWDHYEQFHRLAKVYPNMKVLKYEDMRKDLKSTLLDLSTFFNKPLSNDQIEKLLHHLSFENMKKNPAVNYSHSVEKMQLFKPGHDFRMIRQGKVNTGKEEMSTEMIEKFDAKMRDMQRQLSS